jgi:hypothetical protein
VNAQNAWSSVFDDLSFTYTVHTVGLSIHDLKPRGLHYIIVTEITVVRITPGH